MTINKKKRVLENKKKYRGYINSDEWKKRRKLVLKYYPKCCRCFSTERLNVHHGSYVRLTNEIPSDLCVLCNKCHKEFHDRFGVKESMKKKTFNFIREKNHKFERRSCMPPDEVDERISKKHCKYCNSELKPKKKKSKPNTNKRYYYKQTWICKKNCTHGVFYIFEEDRVYPNVN